MRFLLDEQVNPVVAVTLRKLKQDAAHLQEMGGKGMLDEAVLELACEEQRALATYNVLDFGILARQWMEKERPHFGIILIHEKTIPHRLPGALIRSLVKCSERYRSKKGMYCQTISLTRG